MPGAVQYSAPGARRMDNRGNSGVDEKDAVRRGQDWDGGVGGRLW